MLNCEGYRMMRGTMVVEPIGGKSYKMHGVWLYKPEFDCWYCNGASYPAAIVTIYEDETP